MARAPLTAEEARRRAARAAERLRADRRVRLVFLFGSSAHRQTQVGDIDLAIWTDPPLSQDELFDLRADLVHAAGGDIDLVSLNRASIVLAREVADTGVCLHASPPEFEVEFIARARSRYWDFKPFLEEQWRLAGERLAERRGGPAS